MLHKMIREQFRDKPKDLVTQLIMLAEELEENPRKTLSKLARSLEMPISTAHDRLVILRSRVILRMDFEPIPWESPPLKIPCPKCDSIDTSEAYTTDLKTRRVNITGILCNTCKVRTVRSGLKTVALRAREIEMEEATNK